MTWPWSFSSAHPPLPQPSLLSTLPPCPLLQALSVLPHLSTLAVPQCSRLVGAAIERLPSLVPELRWEGGHRWNTRAAVDAGLTKRRGGAAVWGRLFGLTCTGISTPEHTTGYISRTQCTSPAFILPPSSLSCPDSPPLYLSPSLPPLLRRLELHDCRGIAPEALAAALPGLTRLQALRLDGMHQVG